jgi:hypothetical protein
MPRNSLLDLGKKLKTDLSRSFSQHFLWILPNFSFPAGSIRETASRAPGPARRLQLGGSPRQHCIWRHVSPLEGCPQSRPDCWPSDWQWCLSPAFLPWTRRATCHYPWSKSVVEASLPRDILQIIFSKLCCHKPVLSIVRAFRLLFRNSCHNVR